MAITRSVWERVAPWIAGAGAIAVLAVPIGGFVIIHDAQQVGQQKVDDLVAAFQCQQKALNGLLQDVPLAFAGDKNPHDYAQVAHQCRVAQQPAK